MKRRVWQSIRRQVLLRQKGICAACPARARDVVVPKGAHPTAPDQLAAYCRSCRLKRDAVTRMPKAWATRRRRALEEVPPLLPMKGL